MSVWPVLYVNEARRTYYAFGEYVGQKLCECNKRPCDIAAKFTIPGIHWWKDEVRGLYLDSDAFGRSYRILVAQRDKATRAV
jgi:hypothetical protein